MWKRRVFLMAVGMLAITAARGGVAPNLVVSIRYRVSENNPEKLEKTMVDPLGRLFQKLDRVAQINASATHKIVEFELEFNGETTKGDLATVTSALDQFSFVADLEIISRIIELRPPRMRYDDVQARP